MNSRDATAHDARFAKILNYIIDYAPQKILGPFGVAVSGGGDSMALLLMMHRWAAQTGQTVQCCTVDHNLRPEAREEAEFVAQTCAGLNIPHTVLRWEGWDNRGNLQAEARNARRSLIADWATAQGVRTVALGHTRDDTIETFFMRLFRGAGVTGLSPMNTHFTSNGIEWIRPIENFEREDLRDYLRGQNQNWIEDPSNEDDRFDRVKIRKALAVLSEAGIAYSGVLDSMDKFDLADRALKQATHHLAQQVATMQRCGAVRLNWAEAIKTEWAVRHRLLAHILRRISDASYPPRQDALAALETAINQGKNHSLSGCLVLSDGCGMVEVTREPNAMPVSGADADTYDKRWSVRGPAEPGMEIRPLGVSGLEYCPNWRGVFYTRAALISTPAVWRKDDLIAAPFAGISNGWSCSLTQPVHDFFTSILTH